VDTNNDYFVKIFLERSEKNPSPACQQGCQNRFGMRQRRHFITFSDVFLTAKNLAQAGLVFDEAFQFFWPGWNVSTSFKAFTSICLIRSRVTSKSCPTSSRVMIAFLSDPEAHSQDLLFSLI